MRSTVQPLRVGIWAPLKAPFGAVFAAWAAEDELASWLEALDAAGRARHLAALEAIRRRGYVVERRTPAIALTEGSGNLAATYPTEDDFLVEELEPATSYAVSTIEAPVFHPTGRVALGLVLVGLPRSMRGDEIDRHAQRLIAATRAVTAALRA